MLNLWSEALLRSATGVEVVNKWQAHAEVVGKREGPTPQLRVEVVSWCARLAHDRAAIISDLAPVKTKRKMYGAKAEEMMVM